MNTVFAPQSGFMQSTYTDQMGSALPGQIAHNSDVRLIDTYIVAPDIGGLGLEAGLGFVAKTIPSDIRSGSRTGMNMNYARLPEVGTTIADFEGITIRNQQMDTNINGHACWFGNRTCNGMRAKRIGGRIWVQLSNGVATPNEAVYWIISDTTSHGKPIGSFSGEALGADTLQLTNAIFKSETESSSGFSLALVELAEVLTPVPWILM